MTVAFITNNFTFDPRDKMWVPTGSSFYRCALPAWVTQSLMGRPIFSLTEGFGIDDGQDGLYGFGTVLIKLALEKETFFQVQRAKQLGQRIIVDVDDYYPGLHHTNVAHEATDPNKNKGANREWGEKITLAADTITVSTPFLRDYYSALHPDVRLIRNGVDPSMFAGYQRVHSGSEPIVGWVGAVPWRSEDLETLAGWMPKFMKRNGLTFYHGGHVGGEKFAYELLGLPRAGSQVAGMVPIHRLGTLYELDIGIAPLSNIDFNKAKSGIKFLEYAAAGIPCVGSDLPEYRLLSQDGIGMVAGSPTEWRKALKSLLPPEARIEAAEKATKALLAGHTIAHKAADWLDALERTA